MIDFNSYKMKVLQIRSTFVKAKIDDACLARTKNLCMCVKKKGRYA